MKISYNWLKEHLPLEISASELAAHLLRLGFEVAGHQRLGPAFTGVVVAKIVSRDKHPNAEKLSVCAVDDGAQIWSVVCGAPNAAAGQTVAFARIGAVLPGNFKIGKAKLRGVESCGMICSRSELGLPKDIDGIWVMGEGPAPGTDVGSLLGPADDVLDVDITSNRPDCLSHRGLARELAAYFRKTLTPISLSLEETLGKTPEVCVEDFQACPYYGARLIEGVTVKDSPPWLKTRLESIGLRPINNVADVTNFILHDTGQPLHAFDADTLSGSRIFVRRSKAGETLLALDHKTYDLPAGLLVISDEKKPVALAGVMGAEDTAVTAATRRVLLEGACFAPGEARRSSQATRLRSDSSYRFERGTDPAAPRAAAGRGAALIVQLAGGNIGKPAQACAPTAGRAPIKTSVSRLNSILGADFTAKEIASCFSEIAAELKVNGEELSFTAPSWRRDLSDANDLAEEAARFLGYDNIPYRMAALAPKTARLTPLETRARRARIQLTALGLCEAYNYDLIAEKTLDSCRLPSAGQPRVANPLSEDWSFLRPSLLPGLLMNARYNLSRGADALRLFEIGKVYAPQGQSVSETWRTAGILLGPVLDARWQPARAPRASFYDAKAAVEALLEKSGNIVWAKLGSATAGRTESDPLFHSTNCLRALINGSPVATVGWLHPRAARAYDLDREGAILFDVNLDWLADRDEPPSHLREFSALPVSRRDLALVVEERLPYAELEGSLRAAAGPDLLDIELFDVYQGKGIDDGYKSLAVRLTFGRSDRTLTDADVAKTVEAIVAALAKEVGARLRA